MALRRVVLLVAVLGCAACSAKYRTGPDGLPVGSPDVTYYGPGAGLGGSQVGAPASPPAVPQPANLAAPKGP